MVTLIKRKKKNQELKQTFILSTGGEIGIQLLTIHNNYQKSGKQLEYLLTREWINCHVFI